MPRKPNIINNTEYITSNRSDKMIVESDKMPTKQGSEVNGVVQTSSTEANLQEEFQKPGGRRKKARPTRVFQDELDFVGTEAVTPAMDTDEGIGVDSPDMDRDILPGDESKGSETEMMMEVDEAIACDLCNHSFASQSLLTVHIESVHKIQDDNSTDVFPTRYHQLGNELQQELSSKKAENGDAAVPAAAAAAAPTGASQTQEGSATAEESQSTGSPSGSNKAKIFHKDAFCDLCEREFCNKYFLKTHKANKHGIYESPDESDTNSPSENTAKEGGGGGGGGGGGAGPMPPLLALPQPSVAVGGVIFPGDETFSKTDKAEVFDGASGSSSFSSVASGVSSMIPLPQIATSLQPSEGTPPTVPPPKPIVIEPQVSSEKTTPITSVSPSTTPSKASSITSSAKTVSPDMEDYCEICQKHFCNKYYLKKHKHDVHGIVPEPTPSKRGGRSSQAPTAAIPGSISAASSVTTSSSSFGFSNPMASSASLIMSQTPTSLSNGAVNGAAAPLAGMTAGAMANLMFINPFAPPVAIIQAQPTLQGNASTAFTPQHLAIPQVPSLQPLPTAESPKIGLLSANCSTSNSPSSSLPLPKDALRSMGVLNADAYCELCRKEFCNRYFLRIHKANKHGIYTDDLFAPPPPMGMGPILQVPTIPTSMDPPNLQIISPSFVPDPSKGEKTEPTEKNTSSAVEEKPKVEKDPAIKTEACDVCKKEFNSVLSLRIHMLNAHNVKPKDMDFSSDSLDPSKLDLFFNSPTMQGTMFSNMIAAKLADRVSCDICHKEVCNKYFLRTHKLKVHGIEPSPSEAEQREKMQGLTVQGLSEGPSIKKAEPSSTQETQQRPRDDELLKMGIDPEAYCEICKKEFCSKYFLKTHKLNIHGIKSDKSSESTPTSLSPVAPLGPQFSLAPTIPGLPLLAPSVMPTAVMPTAVMPTVSVAAVPHITSIPTAGEGKAGKVEHTTWKWKEPVNSTRVMCSICNKEVCNKYFLKTHMLKRHGLNYDLTTGIASAPSSIPGIPDHLVTPPMKTPTTVAAAAAAVVEPWLQGLDLSKSEPVKPKIEVKEPVVEKQATEDAEKEQAAAAAAAACKTTGTVQAKTWCVPAQKQGADEDQTATKDQLAASSESSTVKEDLFIQKCELCGMIFGEKVTLQLHMIRDHQAQVTILTEGSTTPTQNGVEARSPNTCNIGLSLRKKYQRSLKPRARSARFIRLGSGIAGIGEKVKSAIVNHIRKNQRHNQHKRFRCAHCQEKFLSRSQCQAHIKSEHTSVKAAGASSQQLQTATEETTTGEQQLDQPQQQQQQQLPPPPPQQPPAEQAVQQPPAESTITQPEEKTRGGKRSRQSTRTSAYATRSSKLNHANATGARTAEAVATRSSQQQPAVTPPRNGKTQIPVGYATPNDTTKPGGIVMQSFTLQEKGVDDNNGRFATSVVHLPMFEKITQPTAVTFMLTPMEQ